MLTRELAIADYESGQVIPDRLTQKRHSSYLKFAEQILTIYRRGTGKTRQQLHRAVHDLFRHELECPIRRIDAFCKLVDEKCQYDQDRKGEATKLRQVVFQLAAARHPLVSKADQLFESNELEVKGQISEKLGMPWDEIEGRLFSDVIQFHRLVSLNGFESANDLLARYNVAQCQAVLYDAVSMTIWAKDDFKSILRFAKLARLMHSIDRNPNGEYVFTMTGPASVLRQTRRYGVSMAKFLPGLLGCRDWRMQANIKHRKSKNWVNRFRLSSEDGLRSHVELKEFDSKLEESFAKSWGEEPRDGWQLIREGDVLHVGQKVFVPDFTFCHQSGKRVLMEVIGFWTPEYLEAKRKTLELFRDDPVLLAVSNSIDLSTLGIRLGSSDEKGGLLIYKTSIRINSVLKQLNGCLEND